MNNYHNKVNTFLNIQDNIKYKYIYILIVINYYIKINKKSNNLKNFKDIIFSFFIAIITNYLFVQILLILFLFILLKAIYHQFPRHMDSHFGVFQKD